MHKQKSLDKSELFERTPVPKAVMTMSLPTVLSSLVMVIYNLVDTYFVGMLNNPIENAAVTLAAPVLLAFNAVNNLFGIGSSSLMSRSLGKKEYDMVRRSSAFGFYCSIVSGALFSLLYTLLQKPLLVTLGTDAQTVFATGEYLKWTVTFGAVPAILNVVLAYLVRAEGNSASASIGTMGGCLLNIVLDPVFILPWGLNLGASGAGLATFLSNCASCAYFFLFLYRKKEETYVCIRPSGFVADRSIVKEVCGVGIPASIQNLLNVAGMTVLNNFTASYGANAVAAMGIAQKIDMIPMYFSMGISQGIMPLVSYNYAAANIRRMKQTILFSAKMSLGFLLVIAAGYYAGSYRMISLFMQNEEIIRYGGDFLRGLCLALPFLCVDFLAVGIFQACGMGAKALVFAILRKIVMEIPALYILNSIWPMYGLSYAQLAAEVVLAVMAVCFVRGILKGSSQRENP